MLEGGKDHDNKKTCSIAISYFKEQSKMNYMQNILGSTDSPPLKLMSSNLAYLVDPKLCSKTMA